MALVAAFALGTTPAQGDEDWIEKALRAEAVTCPLSFARAVTNTYGPFRQWLHWMTRANSGRASGKTYFQELNIDHAIEVPVRYVPADRVNVEIFTDQAGSIADLFTRGAFVALPRHPLSGKDWTASPQEFQPSKIAPVDFSSAPDEKWMAFPTASRTLVRDWNGRLIGIKSPTDHPNPTDFQAEKLDMSQQIRWAKTINTRIEEVDKALGGPDPRIIVLKEIGSVSFKEGKNGYLLRDYDPIKRGMEKGNYYLPAHAIEFVNTEHWVDYAKTVAQARAILALRYGIRPINPHRQQWFLELDSNRRPTGVIVVQDLTDSKLIEPVARWHGHPDWIKTERELGDTLVRSANVELGALGFDWTTHEIFSDQVFLDEMARLLGVPRQKQPEDYFRSQFKDAHQKFEARERERVRRFKLPQ